MTKYFTTTLPYVNADPHLGHALEFVHADITARYYRAQGQQLFLNTGTAEHGLKIFRKAAEQGRDPQGYTDEYAERFRVFADRLGMRYERFIRTTEPSHMAAAQEFWRRCAAAGDIYKKVYALRYCVGCELEKTDSELRDGFCPLHPTTPLETIKEENYFFRFSKYQEPLLALYRDRLEFVVPETRRHEIENFVRRGLEDFSISRLAAKMSWGVSVPGDEAQVMYVWFDALVNYVSAIGWPDSAKAPRGRGENDGEFERWWPVIQFAGKDNLRQQSAMWQAMLLSAGLEPSRQTIIHGFITSGGQKMSKSLGNVIDPIALMDEYGTDALRYYLARHVHPFEDSDVTVESFREAYNANLANGLGNFVARVTALVAKSKVKSQKSKLQFKSQKLRVALDAARQKYEAAFGMYHIQNAADAVWSLIQTGDAYVQETRPWEGEKLEALEDLATLLDEIATLLVPILPETAESIGSALETCIMPRALFPRK